MRQLIHLHVHVCVCISCCFAAFGEFQFEFYASDYNHFLNLPKCAVKYFTNSIVVIIVIYIYCKRVANGTLMTRNTCTHTFIEISA